MSLYDESEIYNPPLAKKHDPGSLDSVNRECTAQSLDQPASQPAGPKRSPCSLLTTHKKPPEIQHPNPINLYPTSLTSLSTISITSTTTTTTIPTTVIYTRQTILGQSIPIRTLHYHQSTTYQPTPHSPSPFASVEATSTAKTSTHLSSTRFDSIDTTRNHITAHRTATKIHPNSTPQPKKTREKTESNPVSLSAHAEHR